MARLHINKVVIADTILDQVIGLEFTESDEIVLYALL